MKVHNTPLNLAGLDLHNKNTLYIKKQVQIQEIADENKHANMTSKDMQANKERQTYGLGILELMSDAEFSAWEKASSGFSEEEKILAAQKLYPLADLQKLRQNNEDKKSKIQSPKKPEEQEQEEKQEPKEDTFIINANKLNGLRMFNSQNDFISRYKNAYDNIHLNIMLQNDSNA